MRNLKLLLNHELHIGSGCKSLSVNSDTGELYVATEDGQLLAVEPRTGQVLNSVNVKDEDGINWPEGCRFESLQHLPDEQALCAATSSGDLLLWNLMSQQLENVGCVDSGISEMSWSPDQELVVVVTGAGTFIMMTREFDPITEVSLYPEQSGEAEFVQVGWGKKETQFHGSAGKAAAKVHTEEVKPIQSWDDRRPRVTWRGDGQFFAVSVVHPNTGARKVYVWTREGVHHSTSENVDGIEQALSWKPSGSLIASSQRRPNKHDIAFFEKNGLRHGEFTLPFGPQQVKVREVMWNSDSTVLLVWCEDLLQENNSKSYIQLWTTGNYHWYLKQSLQFDGGTGTLAHVLWDIEHAHRLHVLARDGTFLQYTWAWTTSHSIGRSSDDDSLVAVIDGAQVLMYPMRDMVVPPPMSAYQLTLPLPVNHVMFSPSHDLAVVLVGGQVVQYTFSPKHPVGEEQNTGQANKKGEVPVGCKLDAAGGGMFSRCCQLPSQKGVYTISDPPSGTDYPLSTSHYTWISEDLFIFSTVTMTTQPHSVIHKVKVTEDKMSVISSTDVESCIFGVAYDPDTGSVAVQLNDGTILKYLPEDDMLLPWELESTDELRLPVPCVHMEVCTIGEELTVIGLTERYRLYVNDVEVASNCTSFSVHDEFLLLTTLAHTCRCINRHTKLRDLPSLSDGKAHPFDESIRRVERGSRIVVSVKGFTNVVLQMPRGNLETIHPRALVLSAIRRHLDKLHFKEAFVLMRKHRVNMNLIYDHNPGLFMDNVPLFVREVSDVSHINVFLTDLVEEDVTRTMYTEAYERNKVESVVTQGRVTAASSKVDTICDAVRQALIEVDRNRYLLSILTTYVRKLNQELEQALHLVKELRDAGNEMPHISAEEALKYLLFLVDVNELYDIALGTYDFDLVLMVAEKSQKDPKEYIPFLNQLRKLETDYQHYTIDKVLKRYSKALLNISKCGDEHFAECKALINEHRLHSEALQLYSPVSTQYKEIASCYGDLLSGKRRHEEAAVMYVKGENWEMALQSYLSAGDWRQVFCMTAILKYSPEKEVEVARKLTEELKSRNRHSEAAVVLEQYVKDIEEAIVTLILGCHWDEALRLMYKYDRSDFIETDLKPHLIETVEQHELGLTQNRDTFEKHLTRLAVVRAEKEKARLELIEGGGAGVQDSDLFSDTSSATGVSVQSSQYSATSTSSSVYSKMSGRSLKNQRKAEFKKWRLKEGSEFEDFALIAAMAKIVQYTDSLRDEMKLLLRTLVRFHYDKQAVNLQRQYDSFLVVIDKAVPQIWLDEDEGEGERPVFGPNTTANTIAQALQQGKGVIGAEEKQQKLDPVIRIAPTVRRDVKWKLYALDT